MQATVHMVERNREVDFPSLWSRIGHPSEKVYSAFLAQTLSLSPPFRNFFVYEYEALGLADERQPSIRTEAFLSSLDDSDRIQVSTAAANGRLKDQ